MRDQETSARYKAACRVIKDATYLYDFELRKRGHDRQAIQDAHSIGQSEDRCWNLWRESTPLPGLLWDLYPELIPPADPHARHCPFVITETDTSLCARDGYTVESHCPECFTGE